MAEGLARARFGARVFVQSAGSKPSRVNPWAIEAMDAIDIDIRGHASTAVDDVDPARVDLIITLCADEVCPLVLGGVEILHWPFADPDYKPAASAAVQSLDDATMRARFATARDAIAQRLSTLDDRFGRA